MIDPDFRLNDDEDAFLDVYEAYWAIWKGVFKQPAQSRLFNEINRHLYVMELRIAGADADELIEAFQSEHRSFIRKAYGTDDHDQHHFGVAYLAADADSGDQPREVPASDLSGRKVLRRNGRWSAIPEPSWPSCILPCRL